MSKPWTASQAAWLLAGLCWVLAIGTIGLYVLNELKVGIPGDYEPESMNMVMAITFPPVGALIVSRKPRHAAGWIFLAIGLGQAIGQLSLQYAFYTIETDPGSLPLARAAYLVQDTIWFPSFGFFILLLALFPDGQPLSRRWRWLPWMLAAAFGVFIISLILAARIDPRPMRFVPAPVDTFGIEDTIFDLSFDLLLLSLLAAVISLFLRFRRSSGVERQQLKWFALAGIVFLVVFTVLSVLSAWAVLDRSIVHQREYQIAWGILKILFPLAAACLPVAVGMAILRYRLYDIDLIIRRTLIYSVLTLVLALIYFATVLVLQGVFVRLTGRQQSEIATVISTLTIAGGFTPLRFRVQDGIDRRFYRKKYDVEQTLAEFGESLRDEVDLSTLVERIEAVVQETLQPESVGLWLNVPAEEPALGEQAALSG